MLEMTVFRINDRCLRPKQQRWARSVHDASCTVPAVIGARDKGCGQKPWATDTNHASTCSIRAASVSTTLRSGRDRRSWVATSSCRAYLGSVPTNRGFLGSRAVQTPSSNSVIGHNSMVKIFVDG